MQINTIQEPYDAVYFESDFLALLESHLTYLRTVGEKQAFSINNQQNYKYEGDLYGLLDELKISKNYHYIVMRVNGYASSNDFKGDVMYIVLPDLNEVESLKSVYQAKKGF